MAWGATRLTFWGRGENGGERVHEFRIGGIIGQYPDSDVATLSNIRLTKEWKQYTIDLRRKICGISSRDSDFPFENGECSFIWTISF